MMKFDDKKTHNTEPSKKTWREIDAGKDKKEHRQQVYTRNKPIEQSYAYRAYKSQLDKVFSEKTGVIKKLVNQPSSQALEDHSPLVDIVHVREQIKQANTKEEIALLVQLLQAQGEWPKDAEMIAQILKLEHEPWLIIAIDTLCEIMERMRPKNARVLIERLQSALLSMNDLHYRDLAQGLIVRLSK